MALLNAVIDLSHHNTVTSFDQIKSDGILAIINKATQGAHIVDRTYDTRRRDALAAGLMFGSYHFGNDDDPIAQADHYLNIADSGDLMVLDFEPNGGGTMSLSQAEAFVKRIHDKIGKFPGLYGNESFLNTQLAGNTTTILKNCFLWIAKYSTTAPKIPPAFPAFTLWQYTDGNAGPQPHSVQGVGHCDRDKFNGDVAGLTKLFS